MILIKIKRELAKHTPHAQLKYGILLVTSIATVIGITIAFVNWFRTIDYTSVSVIVGVFGFVFLMFYSSGKREEK